MSNDLGEKKWNSFLGYGRFQMLAERQVVNP